MADKTPSLEESLQRLAAVPINESPLTRNQWIGKFSKINLQSINVGGPEAETHSLDASWVLLRVGSFWHEDEECHVYSMEHAITKMIEHRNAYPTSNMMVVTPIWVFRAFGRRALPVASEKILRIAEQNFMRFLSELYNKRYKANG